jgi:uridine kinase
MNNVNPDAAEIVKLIRKYLPDATYDECIEAYNKYRMYRDEGQSIEVSKQYAGLI